MPVRSSRARSLVAATITLVAIAGGVGMFAPSAFAHTPIVTGTAACSGGEKVVTWDVKNSQTGTGQAMTIVSAASSQGTVKNLPGNVAPGATVHGTTTLAGNASGTVILTVEGKWSFDGFTKTVASDPVDLQGSCSGSLEVTGAVTGAKPPATWSFAINVECTNPVNHHALAVTNTKPAATQAGIPAGSACTVDDVSAPGAWTSSINPAGPVSILADHVSQVTVTHAYVTPPTPTPIPGPVPPVTPVTPPVVTVPVVTVPATPPTTAPVAVPAVAPTPAPTSPPVVIKSKPVPVTSAPTPVTATSTLPPLVSGSVMVPGTHILPADHTAPVAPPQVLAEQAGRTLPFTGSSAGLLAAPGLALLLLGGLGLRLGRRPLRHSRTR